MRIPIRRSFFLVIIFFINPFIEINGQSLPVTFSWIKSPIVSKNTNDWKSWLNKKSNVTSPFNWKEINKKNSLGGTHLRFQLYLHKLPVTGAEAIVFIKKNGKGLAASYTAQPEIKTDYPPKEATCWLFQNNSLIPCLVRDKKTKTLSGPSWIRYWENIEGETLYDQNMIVYYSDSTGLVSAFKPDPLTKAQVTYGGVYKDINDENLNVLAPLQDTVSLLMTFSSGLFFLSNFAASISEFDHPIVNIPSSFNGEFFFSRSDPGFEMTNALYHVTKMKLRIDSLGFNNLVNYSIPIDVNAMNGSDNSAFDPGTTPPTLLFGEGGVDDAEDADVIIHEYSHAISHSAAPNSLFGTERQCLDEALGDYFASSYSRQMNPFNWENVFSWDGHNEFWAGRSAINSQMKMYPNITFTGIYEHTDLFVDPLMRLWTNHGPDIVDKLLLESIHNWSSGISFSIAANWILVADSALYSGLHSSDIHLQFAKWNILSPKASNQDIEENMKKRDFMTSGSWLVPRDLQNIKAQITDGSGRHKWSGYLPNVLFLKGWPKGVYYIKTVSKVMRLVIH